MARYPFDFYQADAFEFLAEHGLEFDAIHASPPCQAYSNAARIRNRSHPDFVGVLRLEFLRIGKPHIIENVVGAPLFRPVMLCGASFPGLCVYRHRLFETSFMLPAIDHKQHTEPQCKMGRPPQLGDFVHVVGNFSNVAYARLAMGIDWMTRDELREAIPPAYTEYVGGYLMSSLLKSRTSWGDK
jgi:DNA (cytosine-5)-methyltransferase 1